MNKNTIISNSIEPSIIADCAIADEYVKFQETLMIKGKPLNCIELKSSEVKVEGLHWFKENTGFCRLPENRMDLCSDWIKELAYNTAGVRIRFRTNSPAVGIQVVLEDSSDYSHMPRSCSAGFDFYLGQGKEKQFVCCMYPEANQKEIANTYDFGNGSMREITINFPLYKKVEQVRLLIEPGSDILSPTPHAIEKPIVFYGSSIMQGACASRPGNCHSAILSRWLDADSVNLGFSSGARGETIIAELISEIEMSLFVMSYDNNAPDVKHLEDTHEKFYMTFRKKRPDIPVIFTTKTNYDMNSQDVKDRVKVIYKTYTNALEKGEKVYFIDGSTLFGIKDQDSCVVDGIHPNDLGFMRMAEGIYPVIKEALISEGYGSVLQKGGNNFEN